MKLLLKRFHLNGQMKGFNPQTQNLDQEANELKVQCESVCTAEEVSF